MHGPAWLPVAPAHTSGSASHMPPNPQTVQPPGNQTTGRLDKWLKKCPAGGCAALLGDHGAQQIGTAFGVVADGVHLFHKFQELVKILESHIGIVNVGGDDVIPLEDHFVTGPDSADGVLGGGPNALGGLRR